MAHQVTYYNDGHDRHTFRCRCGATCEWLKTKAMVEDEVAKHAREVARIRKPTTCSLDTEYRHAKAMSENHHVSKADRVLWKQQADELGKRLGFDAPPSIQDQLFTLET